MCGRLAFFSPREALMRLFGLTSAPELEPRYNVAPSQPLAVVITTGSHGRELRLMRWGLVPYWAADKRIGARLINARVETLTTKPAFREAFERRRCLVLADGYYEWGGAVREPYFVRRPDHEPFALAGLFERWHDRDTGEVLESCVIITGQASAPVAVIHNRMPIVIPREAYSAWLDPTQRDTANVERLLISNEREPLVTERVGRRVNNPANEGADLIRPAP
jgi:putative SOS response-associated peptidase YedK